MKVINHRVRFFKLNYIDLTTTFENLSVNELSKFLRYIPIY